MPTENPRAVAEGSTPSPQQAAPVCPVCGYSSELEGEQFCPRDGAFLVDPEDLRAAENDPLLGRRIADFAIVARIGTGGMGTVYRAIQVGMDRQVALKVLRGELTDDPQVVQRFLQEAKATARLQHRNLAITYTSGSTSDGLFYLAMEHISGGSLAQLIERSWVDTDAGPVYTLALSRAIRLFTQIVSALTHAHRLGIVHRDLKPDNVLIQHDEDEGEQAKIVDFGIAKILWNPDGKSGLVKTDANTNLGTALYMAPERFAGAPGDPRMDVYALGLLLQELVSGLLPFANRYEDRETPSLLLHKRLTMAVPPLSASQPVSSQLSSLHAALLDREPQRRPAHAGEVRQRVNELPEVAGLRMAVGMSGAIPIPTGDFSSGDRSPVPADRVSSRSLPPQAPRSVQSGPRIDLLPPIPPASRSLPPLPYPGLTPLPLTRSLPPPPSPSNPPQPSRSSLPPIALAATPASTSLPPATTSLPDQFPSPAVSGQVAALPPGRSITVWLLLGSVVLLVLLVLLILKS